MLHQRQPGVDKQRPNPYTSGIPASLPSAANIDGTNKSLAGYDQGSGGGGGTGGNYFGCQMADLILLPFAATQAQIRVLCGYAAGSAGQYDPSLGGLILRQRRCPGR